MNDKQFQTFRTRVVSKMQMASAETIAKTADVHVCSTTCHIPGSGKGTCATCGVVIYFTDLQHAGLRKICLQCAASLPEFDKAIFVAARNSPWDGYPEN